MKRLVFASLIGFMIASAPLSAQNSGLFTDPRDGQTYKTVKIGNQTWFAENLRYLDTDTTNAVRLFEPDGVCYDYEMENCEKYGALYSYDDARAVCPSGWKLPTLDDWDELIDYLGGDEVAGGKLKSTKLWDEPNTGATNESGFAALPAGEYSLLYYDYDLDDPFGFIFELLGVSALFWADNELEHTDALGRTYDFEELYGMALDYDSEEVFFDIFLSIEGFSVRCLME